MNTARPPGSTPNRSENPFGKPVENGRGSKIVSEPSGFLRVREPVHDWPTLVRKRRPWGISREKSMRMRDWMSCSLLMMEYH